VIYTNVRRWALQATLNPDPPMPKGFYGRLADRWRALLSVADAVGHGDEARQAAEILTREHTDEDSRVILLADIRRVFDALGVAQITTALLLKHLLEFDEWAEPPLTRTQLSRMLSSFGIKTRTIWPPNRTAATRSERGYTRAQFERAWTSYCDQGNTPPQSSKNKFLRRL
jgi:hypothetical protein